MFSLTSEAMGRLISRLDRAEPLNVKDEADPDFLNSDMLSSGAYGDEPALASWKRFSAKSDATIENTVETSRTSLDVHL
jgi:hypothetical protein